MSRKCGILDISKPCRPPRSVTTRVLHLPLRINVYCWVLKYFNQAVLPDLPFFASVHPVIAAVVVMNYRISELHLSDNLHTQCYYVLILVTGLMTSHSLIGPVSRPSLYLLTTGSGTRGPRNRRLLLLSISKYSVSYPNLWRRNNIRIKKLTFNHVTKKLLWLWIWRQGHAVA
jgi:hypothetical protein